MLWGVGAYRPVSVPAPAVSATVRPARFLRGHACARNKYAAVLGFLEDKKPRTGVFITVLTGILAGQAKTETEGTGIGSASEKRHRGARSRKRVGRTGTKQPVPR